MKPRYEINVGSNRPSQLSDLLDLEHTVSTITGVSTSMLGVKSTYYKGDKYMLCIVCSDYIAYNHIVNRKIKYNSNYFLCNEFSTLESRSLMYHNIYGATYVHYDGNTLRAATPDEMFVYLPQVAGIDLEMLTLNPVDPSCVLYMGTYYSKQLTVVLYTAEYADSIEATQEEADEYITDKLVYMQVKDKYELAKKLADIVAYEAPDVVTGHNIYNADFPLLYFTLRATMSNWTRMCIGAEPFFQYTRKLQKRFVDSEAGIVAKIPGCHIIDTYFFLDNTLPSEEKNSLRLGDVCSKYLGATKDPLTYKDLERIYHNGTIEEKKLVMKYCARDSYLTVELYKKFNIWNYHSGIYSISGVDAQRSVCTGAVEITYGMCYKKAKSMQLFIDTPANQVFRPSGGLVLNSLSGMFLGMHCIDFTSLYPNICMQHNIDALTVVKMSEQDIVTKHGQLIQESYYIITTDGQVVGLRDKDGAYVYFYQQLQSVLPAVLDSLLQERNILKSQLKMHHKDSLEYMSVSGQEQARKIGANGTCGALAEKTEGNPMTYCRLNDVITTTGRLILQIAEDVAKQMNIAVVYGDTDSLMLLSKEKTQMYLDAVHSLLPERIRFKIEYIADVFIMGKKKHYIAKIGDEVKIAGYKAVKSSSCKMAQTIFRWLIDKLVNQGISGVLEAYEYMLDEYERIVHELDLDLVASNFSYKGKAYKIGTYRHKIISSMLSRGVELVAGNTLSLVTIKSNESYIRVYGQQCTYAYLPSESEGKACRMYTVEEISKHIELVDIRDIIETQCGSDLRNILRYCEKTLT